jgi:hypothetical protein
MSRLRGMDDNQGLYQFVFAPPAFAHWHGRMAEETRGGESMPIHDWTRVEAGDFHDFHQCWVVEIRNALNRGLLPAGYMAMTDQVTGRPIPDVVTLQTSRPQGDSGGIAVAAKPPTARTIARLEKSVYARRADRIVIRHGRGTVVAIIEVVSPGNKSSQNAIRTFVEKAADILNQGIHLLVVDLFPPTPRDPQGIQKAICDQFDDLEFQLPPDKPLTVGAYLGGDLPEAYIEPVGVGDALPSLPIFLSDARYIPAPLETTYMQAWEVYPSMLKEIVEGRAG